jgi:DNA (cytosine-5)-methyltransferase 1
MTDRTRILRVTAGNLRQSHLYVNGHFDFFSQQAFGGSRRASNGDGTIEIYLDGLNETVTTDIGSDAKSGKPRGFLRGRSWVRRFYEFHEVKPGTLLSLEKITENKFRLSVTNHPAKAAHRAAEFFAGIGLVRLALERKQWNVVFANDIDADKAEMYRANWPKDEHLCVQDIHLLNADDIPTCELFTASFPCNDLSIAGRWEGLDGRESSAFWGLMRILRDLGDRRPPLVMIENVVGFLMSKKGRDFEKALLALNELDYVVDAFILNAVHWVPQSRCRLFVIASQDDPGKERKTAAFISDSRPAALLAFIHAHDNIRWDLRDLPPLPPPSKKLIDIVENLPDNDPHWWDKERAEYFLSQMSDKHRAEADRMIDGRAISYATAFRRVRHGKSMAELRTDGIAGCLRTPRGGSGRQILFKAGRQRYQVRLLTARECARLQGVPDNYKVDVPLNQALFGFGDAVCVPAVEWIITNYLNPLVVKTDAPALTRHGEIINDGIERR